MVSKFPINQSLALLLLACLTTACSRPFVQQDFRDIGRLNSTELAEKIHTDARLILLIHQNIIHINRQAENYFAAFQSQTPSVLSRPQRQEIREIWIQYLDQLLELTKIMVEYQDYQKVEPCYRDDAFLVSFSADMLLYSTGLYFLENTAFIAPLRNSVGRTNA
ncbi:MAG: hypothetical protein ACP5FZ_02080 [Fidelibacterota bacterium]